MILRLCVCIPTYDNPATIETVVEDCLATMPFPLLVVDDGSAAAVTDILRSASTRAAMDSGRLRVLRLETNQGKGVALRRAFADCVERGFTHMMALDGDGQHYAREIMPLVEVARAHPWDLIIGARKLDSATVPGSTKFGRKFSNYWVGFQTGQVISDSQSGFRLYPLFHVQNCKFLTKRYDFEIEVLIRLLWKNVVVREIEIDCFYPKRSERVSHFDKLWDNVRISLLNTALVILSLLRQHRTPREVALAVGFGVAIGCTPFIGLHWLIVAGVSFLTRLNAGVMLLGSQISVPPIMPLLILASVGIGKKIFGSDSGMATNFSQWLAGSLVLGTVLGTMTGLATYTAGRHLGREKKNESNWNGRMRGGRFGNAFLKHLAQLGGLRAAYACLFFIVPYFYAFAPRARRAANEYWSIVRPEVGFFRRQMFVMIQLFRFGQLILDRVYQSILTTPQFQTNPNGMERIISAVDSGNGVILVSAHMGGWDMAASFLKNDGLNTEQTPVHVVHYQASGLSYQDVKKKSHVREMAGNSSELPIIAIREILQQGKPIGFMGDRPLGASYELVPFFGRLAPFDMKPYRIAMACGSSVLFTAGFKGIGSTYDFYAAEPPPAVATGAESKVLTCYKLTSSFAEQVEAWLRKYPEQWANYYPFWSSVPASPTDVQASRVRNYLAEELQGPMPMVAGKALDSKTTGAPLSLQ